MFYHQKFRKQSLEYLSSFEIVDYFDFHDIYSSDRGAHLVYDWLAKWQDYTFQPNQRLLIIHTDLDYFTSQTAPVGNDLYNFFRCCSLFQLPTEFMIYFTATYGRHQEVFDLCQQHHLQNPTVVETALDTRLSPTRLLKNIDYSPKRAHSKFVCLNGVQRQHRLLLLCYLADLGIIDNNIISYHFAQSTADHTNVKKFVDYKNSEFDVILRSTIPYTNLNDDIVFSSHDLAVLNQHSGRFVNQDFTQDCNYDVLDYQPDILQQALIYIVTETTFAYPYPSISEKFFKAVASKKPFILISSPGSLDKVKQLGFKTFCDFWSEDYDTMQDGSQRLQAVINVIDQLNHMTLEQLQQYSEQMRDIVEYNFNHLQTNLLDNDCLEIFHD